MAIQLTAEDGRSSLAAHVEAKGAEIFAKYGPEIGWTELQQILQDNACVRYPVEILFEGTALEPGEMAHPVPNGNVPGDGFKLYVNPLLLTDLSRVPAVAFYQLVLVNYGEFASSDDAEAFGAAALGLAREAYYTLLCGIADELAEAAAL